MTLSAEEFLRRFCLHVLPKGFVRIRSTAFLPPRCRTEALHAAGTRSTRSTAGSRGLCRRHDDARVLASVSPCGGPWSPSNDSPHARSPCSSHSRDSRLTPRDRHTVSTLPSQPTPRSGDVCPPSPTEPATACAPRASSRPPSCVWNSPDGNRAAGTTALTLPHRPPVRFNAHTDPPRPPQRQRLRSNGSIGSDSADFASSLICEPARRVTPDTCMVYRD